MRMFPPGAVISPSGRIVMAACGRKAEVRQRIRGRCSWCDREVPKGRHYWCGDACVLEMNRRDPKWIRARTLERDKHRCVLCGGGANEADHTIPIVEGGDPFDLANLRALCSGCHEGETSRLAARRAVRRLVILVIVRMLRRSGHENQRRLFEGIEGW